MPVDPRKWLLLNDLPHSSWLNDTVKHIPCSDYRTANVLRLFAAGYRTGFRLTDADGQPTEALRLMASLMDGVTLMRERDLPDNVKWALGIDDKALITQDTWILDGLTGRVKAAFSAFNHWTKRWVWSFLPGLNGALVTYREDGKSRRRMCYIAHCRPNWEMSDDVYEGLWKWNYEHTDGALWQRPAPCPDGYGVLARDPSLGAPGGAGGGGQPHEGGGTAPETLLPAAVG